MLLLAVFPLSIALSSQNLTRMPQSNKVQTLFGNDGGLGGFLMTGIKAGDVNGKSGVLVGGGVSAVFSSKFNLGFAGYGLVTETDADTYSPENGIYKLDMGYGGLVLEPVIGHKKLIHITLPVLLGIGGVGLRTDNFSGERKSIEDDFDRDFEYDESDLILVAEPGLNLELNLLKNIRLNVGVTYRQVYDSNLDGISSKELSGFTGSVGLKFGWF